MRTKHPLRIIIVEDEFVVAQDLARKLSRIGHVVTEHFYNAVEAERYLRTSPAPDVVITDIYFECSPEGLILVERLKEACLPHLIISGGDAGDILRHATEEDAVRVIHKPIRIKELFIRLESLRELPSAAEMQPIAPSLTINQGGKKVLVPYSSIIAVESDKNDFILLTDKQRYLSYGSLSALETILPVDSFARVHRSYIVNLSRVASYSSRGLRLRSGMDVPVGRKYWPTVREKLVALSG